MRICQVVNGLAPETTGGTEIYAAGLAKELVRQGNAVSVFTRSASPNAAEYHLRNTIQDGVNVTEINNNLTHAGAFSGTYENPNISEAFATWLDKMVPDVVHFQHLIYLSTSCVREAAKRNIPILMTLHDYWLICQRGRFLKPDLSVCPGQTDLGCAQCFAHLLDPRTAVLNSLLGPLLRKYPSFRDIVRRLFGRRVSSRKMSPVAVQQIRQRMEHVRELCQLISLFLAPSRYLRQQFLNFGIPEDKIIYHECGLDTNGFEDPKSTRKRGALRFGYIGVVDPVKGVDLLVEAFQPVQEAELNIYGAEARYAPYPDERRFRRQLLRSSRIQLMGSYNRTELGQILSEVDVVIVPSIWYENAPLVIREAFLARKPVITADFGGMKEWVEHGVNGLLFRPRNIQELRRTILRFVEEPDLVSRLSRNFPKVRSISEDAEILCRYYRDLTEKSQPE